MLVEVDTQRSPAPLNTALDGASRLPALLDVVTEGGTLPVALNGKFKRLPPP
jgi:hypothetical protein